MEEARRIFSHLPYAEGPEEYLLYESPVRSLSLGNIQATSILDLLSPGMTVMNEPMCVLHEGRRSASIAHCDRTGPHEVAEAHLILGSVVLVQGERAERLDKAVVEILTRT